MSFSERRVSRSTPFEYNFIRFSGFEIFYIHKQTNFEGAKNKIIAQFKIKTTSQMPESDLLVPNPNSPTRSLPNNL